MDTTTTYVLPEPLVQAIVSYLNSCPAGHTRVLLNDLEAHCRAQDQERIAAREALLIEQGRQEAQSTQE